MPVARSILVGFHLPSLHQRLVTFHAKHSLRRPCVFQILDPLLAIATSEAVFAECSIASENSEVFNLVSTHVATVGAVAANDRPIAQKEEVRVRVKYGPTSIAAKAVCMPSIPIYPGFSISITY